MSAITNDHELDSSSTPLMSSQQIAHDLRSPLSALNFVSSLNPDLPDASRDLLEMAIRRLQELADKLDIQS